MKARQKVIVALSGGVDSAVAAVLLKADGYTVECLHMSNWEDDGYCDNAREFQHAREICDRLDLPLHRVNFTDEYRQAVFADFLDELDRGRTPNPDVLCNREIKFGVLHRYARRLGGEVLATGHYARLEASDDGPRLLKGHDTNKDQSYFLHAVPREQFADVLFPIGDLEKDRVRSLAAEAGLPVANKKDSTGICFIGERPFTEFLSQYLPRRPGPIVTTDDEIVGRHAGLAFYTLGQRHGLEIGGLSNFGSEPWYVAAKRQATNELVVVQGSRHPALYSSMLLADSPNWLSGAARAQAMHGRLECTAKTRYRQPDQRAMVSEEDSGRLRVAFEQPQRAVTPGQFVVFYAGQRCLGGARIDEVRSAAQTLQKPANWPRAVETS